MAKNLGALFFACVFLIIVPAVWAKPSVGMATPLNSSATISGFPFHYEDHFRVYNGGNESGRYVINVNTPYCDVENWLSFNDNNFTLAGGTSKQVVFAIDTNQSYIGNFTVQIRPTLESVSNEEQSRISAHVATSSTFEFRITVPEGVGNESLGIRPLCGDGVCGPICDKNTHKYTAKENCETCPADCGACPEEEDEGGGGAGGGGGGGAGGGGGLWDNLTKRKPEKELPAGVEIIQQLKPITETQPTTLDDIVRTIKSLPEGDARDVLNDIKKGIDSGELKASEAKKTLEVNKLIANQQITYKSQITIKVTVPEDADYIIIIEIIPASMAQTSANVQIDSGPSPKVLLDEPPVLEWTINNVKSGQEISVGYSVPGIQQRIGARTIVVYSPKPRAKVVPEKEEIIPPRIEKPAAIKLRLPANLNLAAILPYALLAVVIILALYLSATLVYRRKNKIEELLGMLREASRLIKVGNFEKAVNLSAMIEQRHRKLEKKIKKKYPRLATATEKIRMLIKFYTLAKSAYLQAKSGKVGGLEPKLKKILELANMVSREEHKKLYDYAMEKHDYCLVVIQKKKELNKPER